MKMLSKVSLTYENETTKEKFTAPEGVSDAPDWVKDTWLFQEAVKRGQVIAIKEKSAADVQTSAKKK